MSPVVVMNTWNIELISVDDSEIRRSPVEVGSLSHYLRKVLYIRTVVVWDF